MTFVEISVPADLLPHVTRDLLAIANDANHVAVSTGEAGPIILVHPDVAEVWYQKVATEKVEDSTTPGPEAAETSDESPVATSDDEAPEAVEVVATGEVENSTEGKVVATGEVEDSTTPEPEVQVQFPVKRGPGRPRKATSVSEDSTNG